MIPILFEENETNFTSNGIGRLSDAVSCNVIEERNGQYTLEMIYPISGKHYSDIRYSRYIFAIPSDGTQPQPFRIYKISKPMSGRVEVLAEHRSYQLRHIPCGPFTAANCSAALQGLKTNSLESNPFTFWTDKSTVATYTQDVPASIRERLGGVQGSILDTYGGEFEFDNTVVKLHASRGANRGVVLNYGKNIIDINQETNIENTITGVVGFYYLEGTLVQAPAVYTANADAYPYKRTIPVDFTQEFDTVPTTAQLQAKATSYLVGLGVPSVNITVSFVALWQTEEYKEIANLERVKLCDTITVYFEKLGIEATAKVVKTDYDVLKERYNSIEIGDSKTTLSTQIAALNQEVKETPSMMQGAIDKATNLITGGLGGYVVMKKNANGKPEEILIMDTDDVQTAVNVIRMNKNGIGFSTTGYNGPFTTAWTIDGSFVADFITAGTLRAIDIEGVNITGSTLQSSNADNSKQVNVESGWIRCISPVGSASGISVKEGSRGFTMHSGNIYGYNDTGVNTIVMGHSGMGFLYLKDSSGNTEFSASGSGSFGTKYFAVNGSGTSVLNQYGTATVQMEGNNGSIYCNTFTATGTKSRVAATDSYGERKLYCYESPTPYFGDIGEGKTDESGKCYIFLDDVFGETIEGQYQVFIQSYGQGSLYVSERTPSYFVVEGSPSTAFGWELKAPQKGYSLDRLEPFTKDTTEAEEDTLTSVYDYLTSTMEGEEDEEH